MKPNSRLTLGIDCDYKYAGLSASTQKAELYANETLLRQDITGLIAARRVLRHGRSNRKTCHRAPRFNKYVHTKHKGWLAPSVEHRIDSHLRLVDKVCRLLPVTAITVETASFDLQAIKNPEVSGIGYQQGEQLGFWNVREYVLWRDGYVCLHCRGKSKDQVLNVNHPEIRRIGGDAPNNLITLCKTCPRAYHEGKIDLKIKRGKSLRAQTLYGGHAMGAL